MTSCIRRSLLTLVGALAATGPAWAEEIRVVDRSGLVRAVRTVKKQSTIILELDASTAKDTKECVLSNIDGLSSERKAPVGADGRCVIRSALATTWQVEVPQRGKYKVRIDE